MRVITAKYNAYSDFRIPKNVPLLSVEDNESDKAWSWWIKWDKLNYVDDKGEHHEIKAYHSASEDEEFKRPDDVQEDEWDTDDEEEAPKCAEEGCENHAAKNEFYPNGDPPNTEYWTLCDECWKKDQDEEDSDDE